MMAGLGSIGRRARAAAAGLRGDRRGAVMPMMAMGMLAGLAAVGTGVDMSRLYLAKNQLQVAADAAALAGGRAFSIDDNSNADRDIQAQAYFDANFAAGYLGSTDVTMAPPNAPTRFQTIDGVYVTTISAAAKVPMLFMQIFGWGPRRIEARARAELQPRPLEVMVVLDNTGSESVNLPADADGVVKTRIQALKQGAKSFLNVLYQGATTRSDLALGFVTYDITVNVGAALLEAGGKIESMVNFNDPIFIKDYGPWPGNRLAWKGCVMDDATVPDLTSVLTYQDPGAYDIGRLLPGEGSNPAVKPFHFPPYWYPYQPVRAASGTTSAVLIDNPNGEYYQVRDSTRTSTTAKPTAANNLFQFDSTNWSSAFADKMANSPIWRSYFYQFFIGLNNGASQKDDDVIVKDDAASSYYDPASNGVWKVRYDRLPAGLKFASRPPETGTVNKDGGKTHDPSWTIYPTSHPSPNFQCPEPAMTVQYGRTRATYEDYIDTKNGAIGPAAGTIHHAGLLWGYRLLVRDDKFSRVNPVGTTPKRALVFMTDGETGLAAGANGMPGYSWYGASKRATYNGHKLSTNDGNWVSQTERRFSKVCEAMKAEKNPPLVYIIALTTTDTATLNMFRNCAPGRLYRTSDTKTLNDAFKAVATELVDLHLTQ